MLFVARCSIVDIHCDVLLDIYVKPDRPVASYRTKYSGITKAHMKNAVPHKEARERIVRVLQVSNHTSF